MSVWIVNQKAEMLVKLLIFRGNTAAEAFGEIFFALTH